MASIQMRRLVLWIHLALLVHVVAAYVEIDGFEKAEVSVGDDANDVFSEFPDENDGYETTELPGIEEFMLGIDYSTGQRTAMQIFKISYNQSDSGNREFLYTDHVAKQNFKIPDQVSAGGWASSCLSSSYRSSSSSSSVSEYLKKKGSGVDGSYDQKTDVEVEVPVEGAKVKAKTQLENVVGYGRSSGSEDYSQSTRNGKQTVVEVRHEAGLWSVQWREYDIVTSEHISISKYFTSEFRGHINSLAAICKINPPNAEGRMSNSSERFRGTECDNAAARFIRNFGTHYNIRAGFGGKISKNYYYDQYATSDTQSHYAKKYSEWKFGLFFFKVGGSSSSETKQFDEAKMEQIVEAGYEQMVGGVGSDNPGAWCTSVRLQPAIVSNIKLVPIAELIDDPVAKYAVMMAILDRWVCNDRSAKFDPKTGKTTCICGQNRDFHLNEFCLKVKPICRDSRGRETLCPFYMLEAGYTHTFRYAWDNQRAALVPIPPSGFAILGGIMAKKGKKTVPRPLIVVKDTTSDEVAVEAVGWNQIFINPWYPHKGSGPLYQTGWSPVCPFGYISLSDFPSMGADWPGMYSYIKVRPCIRLEILDHCDNKLEFLDAVGDSSKYWLYTILGNNRYGLDLGDGGSFFRFGGYVRRDVHFRYKPGEIFFRCLKSDRVRIHAN